MTTTSRQPPWQAPQLPAGSTDLPPLKIYNSLTRSKTAFIPVDWQNMAVSWYACGPTVYDDAHLGHGRNFVSTDIIRRIMRDFFHFRVRLVMNITDIDDKIIVRSRSRHLLGEFNHGHLDTLTDVVQVRRLALATYLMKNLSKIPAETELTDIESIAGKVYVASLSGGDQEAKTRMHITTVLGAAAAIRGLEKKTQPSSRDSESLDDVLMPYIDNLYGSSINGSDHSISKRLTTHYEDRFMEDMRALNCLDPDEVTRVTDYGPQIIEFVSRIERNQFAYESEGNVLFDIGAFEAANNKYARLEPWNRNDKNLQADGEGSLTEEKSGKRGTADFALWKSSKPGEPSWPSPWGPGRPGWHIECSAMAFDKLGSQIDIHSGGIDLAFPHHDNELAQSEAYWADHCPGHQHQWVNYFLHMGHLSISGSKMSKSLKNFTTIREALDRGEWTPRSLRIVFLLGLWRDGIEITPSLVKEGAAWEDKLNNFFINAKDLSLETAHKDALEQDQYLFECLEKAKQDTFNALCDSFHTPTVMATISDLITTHNSASASQTAPSATLAIARWVTSMVNTFGLNGTTKVDDDIIGWSGIDVPEDAKPILASISRKRDELRSKANSGILTKQDLEPVPYPRVASQNHVFAEVLQKFNRDLSDLNASHSLVKDVRQLSDRLRDVDLFTRGIYLEDRENQPALIRPVTKELRAAKHEREDRAQQKQKAKEEREKEAGSKADKGRLSHKDMFRTEEYGAWDADGMPTQEKGGEEVTKSKKKKLQKDWDRQKKLHEAWLKTNTT